MNSIIEKYKNNMPLTEDEQDIIVAKLIEAKGVMERRKQWEALIDWDTNGHSSENSDEPNPTPEKNNTKPIWGIVIAFWKKNHSYTNIAALLILVAGAIWLMTSEPSNLQQFADRQLQHSFENFDNGTSRGQSIDAHNKNNRANPMEINFTEGIELLRQRNYTQAITVFNQITSGVYFNDAKWYISLAYVKLNDTQNACNTLRQINKQHHKIDELAKLLSCQ